MVRVITRFASLGYVYVAETSRRIEFVYRRKFNLTTLQLFQFVSISYDMAVFAVVCLKYKTRR